MQGSTAHDRGVAKPGDVIGGKYRIVRVIGEGGMGIIAEAVHEKLDQRVAIKFHRPQSTDSDESVARFLREAKAAAQIKSEHVVRVTDVATTDGGTPYFVMEYLEGKDLDAVIQSEGPLPVSTTLDYVLQVCEALAEAHSLGIVHRDLKPANLFLATRSDGGVVIKLLDFGISKTLPKGTDAELNMTKTRALMGSPLYMAPEQMRSTRRVDHRADIWSLGVLIHEMLTGETPFEGETLPEVCSSIAADDPILLTSKRLDAPYELEQVILRCLEKEADQRFADVAELAMALATLAPPEAARSIARIVRLQRGPGTTPPPPASMRTTSPSLRPRASFASIRSEKDRTSDLNGDTLAFEPSDQRRSGVAPKMRIRASSPSAQPAGETMQGQVAVTHRTAPASRATAFVAGGVAFMVAAGLLSLALRWHRPASVSSPSSAARPAVVAPVAPPAAPPPGPATATASPDPASTIIEFVDVPGVASAAAEANGHPGSSPNGPKPLVKGHAAAHPSASAAASGSAPAPSGTAAFGASRD